MRFLTLMLATTLSLAACDFQKMEPNVENINGTPVLKISHTTIAANLDWNHQHDVPQYCTVVEKGRLQNFQITGYEAEGAYVAPIRYRLWENECEDGWRVRVNLSAARK